MLCFLWGIWGLSYVAATEQTLQRTQVVGSLPLAETLAAELWVMRHPEEICTMIEIKVPTKEILKEIIKGLLSEKYKRKEVVEWQKKAIEEFDYCGPGVVTAPLKNEDGYWYFVSLAALLDKNKLNQEESYFIRNRDLQNWLNDLNAVQIENKDPQIKNINPSNKKDWKPLDYLLHFNDEKNVLSSKDKSFNFERGVFDDLGGLTELALFEYKNFRFLIEKSYEYFLGLVNLSGEKNTPAIVVAQLLEFIGVGAESLIGVNKKLYESSHKLLRMDDNGLTCVVDDNLNYIFAYLRQKHFELGTHKQTYWVE